ncbi:hypothetical protein MESS4_790121 [Mesorhizobium sp. STM 4661]|nr:hypothetical protein MESS4_790121 [Mesorhizobium sp. STM 4661]
MDRLLCEDLIKLGRWRGEHRSGAQFHCAVRHLLREDGSVEDGTLSLDCGVFYLGKDSVAGGLRKVEVVKEVVHARGQSLHTRAEGDRRRYLLRCYPCAR